jgi:hypothetical protein
MKNIAQPFDKRTIANASREMLRFFLQHRRSG